MSVFDFNSLQDLGHTFSATQKRMVFLTNNATLPANEAEVSRLPYKSKPDYA